MNTTTIEEKIANLTNVPDSTPTPSKVASKVECGRFNGVFAGFALGLYNTLIACKGFPGGKQVAHKVCNDYMSDFARGIKENTEFKSKVGKAKEKDDTCKMKGSMETANIISSNSMKIARIAQQLDELVKEKVLTTRYFPPVECLPSKVKEYLENAETWAKGQQWED